MPRRTAEHGTTGMYNNHGCRCVPCTEANRTHMAAWRARVWQREPPRHDVSGYNNYGCRCEKCTTAQQEAHRAWYAARAATP